MINRVDKAFFVASDVVVRRVESLYVLLSKQHVQNTVVA